MSIYSFPTYNKSPADDFETSRQKYRLSQYLKYIYCIEGKKLWQIPKLLIMSNFSLCHNVFKNVCHSYVKMHLQVRKGLTYNTSISICYFQMSRSMRIPRSANTFRPRGIEVKSNDS